jgi:hypothetical protein
VIFSKNIFDGQHFLNKLQPKNTLALVQQINEDANTQVLGGHAFSILNMEAPLSVLCTPAQDARGFFFQLLLLFLYFRV